ncbi:hypothetical protein V2J09_006475 [Rumex salicifolius]
MSDEKRFQKTFTRRKKVAEQDASAEEEVLLAPSSSAESQGEGGDGDREVAREPIANGGGCSSRVSKSETKQIKGGGGGGNVAKKPQPKQKRKEEEEQSQHQKQKKQRKEELKMKPKQKNDGKKQVGKDGKKELKKKKKEEDKEEEASAGCRFPVSRVDRIIRSEGSDYRITHEAVFLINKASEKFLEIFCGDSYKCAAHDRKSYVSYKHLSTAVTKDLRFDFLSDYVPEKVKADKALAEQKPVEK